MEKTQIKKWEGLVKSTHGETEASKTFIAQVKQSLTAYKDSRVSMTNHDPAESVKYFLTLLETTEKYNELIQHIDAEYRQLLARGMSYTRWEDADKFYKIVAGLQNSLPTFHHDLKNIVDNLKDQPEFQRKGLEKNVPRRHLIQLIRISYEFTIGGTADKDDHDFHAILTQILQDYGIPASRKDRIYKSKPIR